MDKNKLTEIGLNHSEADVYLTLVRQGKASVTTIAQKTGIHRTYIYDVIEKLKEKGLVSQIVENNKHFFSAADPKQLKDYLMEKVETVEDMLPELQQLYQQHRSEVSVEAYKGKDGIKTILNDIVRTSQSYYGVGVIKQFEEIVPIQTQQFVKQVNKQGLKEYAILHKGEQITTAENSEQRLLPQEYPLTSTFVVYGNKVALFIWKEPYIQILIDSEDIAQSYLTQFNILWEMAEKEG